MKKLLGSSPITSIIGYLILGLTACEEAIKEGETNWWIIGIAGLAAVLGRVSADSRNANQ